jgi:hypothetical protein
MKPKIHFLSSFEDRRGNFHSAIIEAIRINPPKPGTLNSIQVAHDDWCALLAGRGQCDCAPEIKIRGIKK